jgi:hypothetical protein
VKAFRGGGGYRPNVDFGNAQHVEFGDHRFGRNDDLAAVNRDN